MGTTYGRGLAAIAIACVVMAVGTNAVLGAEPREPRQWTTTYQWPEHGISGWSRMSDSVNPGGYLHAENFAHFPGLLIGLTGGIEYRPGEASWSFDAPGSTRILSGRFEAAHRNKLFAHHCVGVAFIADDDQIEDMRCAPPEDLTDSGFSSSSFTMTGVPSYWGAKSARFSAKMPTCKNPNDVPCSKWIPKLDLKTNGPVTHLSEARLTLIDDDAPGIEARGPLRDLNESYIDGKDTYSLDLDAEDGGSGVAVVSLMRMGAGAIYSVTAPCDPSHHTPVLGARICPSKHLVTRQLDSRELPEGENTFLAEVADYSGHISHSTSWSVTVDRSAPASVNDLEIDYDEETSEAVIGWDSGDDPPLMDGTDGSGVDRDEYRFKRGNASDWSEWEMADGDSFSLENAMLNEAVEVEVRSIDGVGNISEIAYAKLHVAVAPCTGSDEPEPDYVGRSLHRSQLPATTEFDSFTLALPMSQPEFLARIPAGIEVLSVLERTDVRYGGSVTSGVEINPEMSLNDNLEFWNAYTAEDTEQLQLAYEEEKSNVSTPSLVKLYRTSLELLADRRAIYAAAGGIPIKSFAVRSGNGVREAVAAAFAGSLDIADSDLTPASDPCDDESIGASSAFAIGGHSSSREATISEFGATTAPYGQLERKSRVNWKSLSPPAVRAHIARVHKDASGFRDYARAELRWYWKQKSNSAYYWSSSRSRRHEAGRRHRGFEMQLEFDQETSDERASVGEDGPYAIPVWREKDPNGENTTAKVGRTVRRLWSVENIRCPYPDDYDNIKPGSELNGDYALTVGAGCRPSRKNLFQRWTHFLHPQDDRDDRLKVSIAPVHYAQSSHKVAGFSQLSYCQGHRNDEVRGGCHFHDNFFGSVDERTSGGRPTREKSDGIVRVAYVDSFRTENLASKRERVKRLKPGWAE